MTNHTPPNMPPLPQQVTSERLVIRPSRRCDRPYLQKWWNDPNVTEPGGNVDGMQYDDAAMDDWFRRYVDGRNEATHFIIELAGVKRPIGEFYIASDDRPGCVGVALVIGERDVVDGGYGAEALHAYAGALFETNTCEAIRVDLNRANTRAVRMCEDAGFTVEHVWANGQFQTMILTQAAYELAAYQEELRESASA